MKMFWPKLVILTVVVDIKRFTKVTSTKSMDIASGSFVTEQWDQKLHTQRETLSLGGENWTASLPKQLKQVYGVSESTIQKGNRKST